MKKLFSTLCLLLIAGIITAQEKPLMTVAQQRQTKKSLEREQARAALEAEQALQSVPTESDVAQETEMVVEKKPSKFFFGIAWRSSLAFREHISLRIPGMGTLKGNDTPPDIDGKMFLVTLGVDVTKNWSVAAEFGLGAYANASVGTFYTKAQYFYGEKRNRWFNYANLGGVADSETIGLIAGVGAGYRMTIGRRTELEFMLGYELIRLGYNDLTLMMETAGVGSQFVDGIDMIGVRHAITLGVGFVF